MKWNRDICHNAVWKLGLYILQMTNASYCQYLENRELKVCDLINCVIGKHGLRKASWRALCFLYGNNVKHEQSDFTWSYCTWSNFRTYHRYNSLHKDPPAESSSLSRRQRHTGGNIPFPWDHCCPVAQMQQCLPWPRWNTISLNSSFWIKRKQFKGRRVKCILVMM